MDAQTILTICAQKPDEFLYLLVNALYPITQDSALHVENLTQHSPLAVPRADFAHNPKICPQLVILAMPDTAPNEDLLNVSIETALEEIGCSKQTVCGWIVSKEGPLAIANTLAAHCIVREHADAPRQLLPMFEPHRLALLKLTAPNTWLDAWLGSITSWVLIDPSGQAQKITRSQTVAWDGLLPLEAARGQRNAPASANLIETWRHSVQGLPADATQRALQEVLDAERAGLSTLEDKLVFGLSRLTIHPRFDQHPSVRIAIENAIKTQTPLAQGLEAIPDIAWRQTAKQAAH